VLRFVNAIRVPNGVSRSNRVWIDDLAVISFQRNMLLIQQTASNIIYFWLFTYLVISN